MPSSARHCCKLNVFCCELSVLQGLDYGTLLATAKLEEHLLLFLWELKRWGEGRVSQESSHQEGRHPLSTNKQDLGDRKSPSLTR